MTSSFDKVWRASLSSLIRQADSGGVSRGEGWPRGVVDALHSHAKVSTDNAETMVVVVLLEEETDESASDVFVCDMDR